MVYYPVSFAFVAFLQRFIHLLQNLSCAFTTIYFLKGDKPLCGTLECIAQYLSYKHRHNTFYCTSCDIAPATTIHQLQQCSFIATFLIQFFFCIFGWWYSRGISFMNMHLERPKSDSKFTLSAAERDVRQPNDKYYTVCNEFCASLWQTRINSQSHIHNNPDKLDSNKAFRCCRRDTKNRHADANPMAVSIYVTSSQKWKKNVPRPNAFCLCVLFCFSKDIFTRFHASLCDKNPLLWISPVCCCAA